MKKKMKKKGNEIFYLFSYLEIFPWTYPKILRKAKCQKRDYQLTFILPDESI